MARRLLSAVAMSDLLDLALKAHGGLDRWREVKSLDVRASLTGALYHLKGYPEGVPNVTVRIDTRRPAVTISPYARPDHRGYFTPDRVWIEDRAGQIVDERRDPRASFAGHVRETPWDQLHRLYFTGYAMWNYLTTPFLFTRPGFELTEIKPHQENGDTWRCLRVNFPSDALLLRPHELQRNRVPHASPGTSATTVRTTRERPDRRLGSDRRCPARRRRLRMTH